MDFLVVGQGLAGTLIGYRLERAGHRVDYVDAPAQTAASDVAAGIINPITGRRFVKSWRIDELIPAARELYAALEKDLGVRLWYDLPLVRTLHHPGDRNSWEARSGEPGYEAYMDDDPDVEELKKATVPVYAYAGLRHSARVDAATLVRAFRERLVSEGRIQFLEFDWEQLPSVLRGAAAGAERIEESNGVGDTPSRTYDHVIAAEGWRSRYNPWFSYLPTQGTKGEVLIIRTEEPVPQTMFKHRVFLVPYGERTYWVGATAFNHFTEDAPTAEKRAWLVEHLDQVLTLPYEIVAHRAAVRPTVRDRRPFLGRHPTVAGLWIFNGLGTKGASIGPLASRWLAEHILVGAGLPGEVDIGRWG